MQREKPATVRRLRAGQYVGARMQPEPGCGGIRDSYIKDGDPPSADRGGGEKVRQGSRGQLEMAMHRIPVDDLQLRVLDSRAGGGGRIQHGEVTGGNADPCTARRRG